MVSDIEDIEKASEPLGVANEVILASAGTGKTQSLSARYLRLLHKDQPADRILATTFTRKAAGEIFERIFYRLARAVHHDEERRFLSEQIGETLTSERCQELLLRLTRRLNRIRVGTLDSFFQQVATSLAPELGLPPVWEIADDIDDKRLRAEALRRMLEKNPVHEVTELVHMVAKGETDRRTTDVLMKTVDDLYNFYRDSLVEGDKAWTTKKLPEPLNKEQFATAQAAFDSITLPENKTWTNAHRASGNAIQFEDWKSFLTKGISEKIATGQSHFARVEISADILTAYQPLIQHALARLLLDEARKVAGARTLIEKFVAEYEQLKIDRESICFDDIPARLADLGRNDRDRLAYRMDAQLDHLLLDEFQDTSGTQWRAIRPFADRVTRRTDDDGSLFCVGDVKQAIYGWRGGQAEILKTLRTQLENVNEEQLVKTWRCSPPVVETVNQTFRKIPLHPNLGDYEDSIKNWCDEFKDHEAARDHVGYATLMTGDLANDTDSQDVATLKSIARLVGELQLSLGPKRTIGVLVHSNKTVRDLIGYLRDNDVWASQEGKSPLTDSAAIQQILSACRLADNPGESAARFHLEQGILKDEEGLDDDRVRAIAAEYRRQLVELGYGIVVQQWADTLRPSCSEHELQRLQQIVEIAYLYQSRLSHSRSALRANDFVDFVETQGVSNSTSANVRVMVIHQSKGLQFDAVVVGELDKRILGQAGTFVVRRSNTQFWPEHIFTNVKSELRSIVPPEIRKTRDRDQDVKCREAMCRLYVAMTRSIHALYMVVAPNDPEKKFSGVGKNVAGLLRAALTEKQPAEPNTELYEAGDSRWYEKLDDEPQQESPAPPVAKRIRLKKRGAGSRRGQEALSPSQRSAGAAVKGNDWFGRDRASAMEYGSLIHAWFEQVEWLERDLFSGGPPEETTLRQIAVQLPARWINVDNAINDFHRMIKEPRICNLLHQNAYAPEFRRWLQTRTLKELPKSAKLVVRNEQPIVFEDQGLVGSGTIDRLVLVYVGDQVVAADVIDHKTDGAKSDADARKHANFYGPQLRKYRDAVAKMFSLAPKRIRMRLALLNGGRIAEVE